MDAKGAVGGAGGPDGGAGVKAAPDGKGGIGSSGGSTGGIGTLVGVTAACGGGGGTGGGGLGGGGFFGCFRSCTLSTFGGGGTAIICRPQTYHATPPERMTASAMSASTKVRPACAVSSENGSTPPP